MGMKQKESRPDAMERYLAGFLVHPARHVLKGERPEAARQREGIAKSKGVRREAESEKAGF